MFQPRIRTGEEYWSCDYIHKCKYLCFKTVLNNDTNQLGFLDVLNIASFCLGLMNLEENLTQGDKQELQEDLSKKADKILEEIHGHLKIQDSKLDDIIRKLEELENEKNGEGNKGSS